MVKCAQAGIGDYRRRSRARLRGTSRSVISGVSRPVTGPDPNADYEHSRHLADCRHIRAPIAPFCSLEVTVCERLADRLVLHAQSSSGEHDVLTRRNEYDCGSSLKIAYFRTG